MIELCLCGVRWAFLTLKDGLMWAYLEHSHGISL
jgi:hypothetical protein